jgi:hypothetical protein
VFTVGSFAVLRCECSHDTFLCYLVSNPHAGFSVCGVCSFAYVFFTLLLFIDCLHTYLDRIGGLTEFSLCPVTFYILFIFSDMLYKHKEAGQKYDTTFSQRTTDTETYKQYFKKVKSVTLLCFVKKLYSHLCSFEI